MTRKISYEDVEVNVPDALVDGWPADEIAKLIGDLAYSPPPRTIRDGHLLIELAPSLARVFPTDRYADGHRVWIARFTWMEGSE